MLRGNTITTWCITCFNVFIYLTIFSTLNRYSDITVFSMSLYCRDTSISAFLMVSVFLWESFSVERRQWVYAYFIRTLTWTVLAHSYFVAKLFAIATTSKQIVDLVKPASHGPCHGFPPCIFLHFFCGFIYIKYKAMSDLIDTTHISPESHSISSNCTLSVPPWYFSMSPLIIRWSIKHGFLRSIVYNIIQFFTFSIYNIISNMLISCIIKINIPHIMQSNSNIFIITISDISIIPFHIWKLRYILCIIVTQIGLL